MQAMESGDVNSTSDILKTNQPTNLVEANCINSSEQLRSSSILSSSSSSLSKNQDEKKHGSEPTPGEASEPEPHDVSTTDHPPPSPTTEPTVSPSDSRIPSSVFERSDTATPAEWSVASNESLFSIHMGNMSFTKEQLNLMYKSGELGYPCDSHGSPLRDFPSNTMHSPHHMSTENGIKASDLDGASVRGMLTDNVQAPNQVDFLRKASNNIGSISQHSDKSFAFPILAGGDSDHKSSGSIIPDLKVPTHRSQPSTPKVAPESFPEPPTPPKEKTPKASHSTSQVKWFSWFPCCTSR